MRSIQFRVSITVSFLVFLSLTAPTDARAVIQSLNGETGQTQTFQNDSNVTISSANNVHTLGWQGLLPVSRGGTGASSFTSGSLFFFNGSSFAQNNSNLFWDNTNNRLGVGTSSPASTLDINGSASISGNLEVTGDITSTNLVPYTGGVQDLNLGENNLLVGSAENSGVSRFVSVGIPNTTHIEGGFSAGTTDNASLVRGVEMNWWNEEDPAESFGYIDTFGYENDLWLNGRNVLIQIEGGGNVGIGGVTNPSAKLDVTGTIKGDSTMFLGTASTPGCIEMADSDGSGVTYITASDGVLTASSTKPSFCQ